MSEHLKEYFKETLSIVVLAFILAMVLRTFVVEGRVIPTGSMLPTIQLQDRVMVNKFVYLFSDPERGDIVVFDPPTELNASEDYIKRIIGLPGETVEMRDHKVFVDGKALKEPYLIEPVNYNWGPVTIPEGCVLVLGDNRNQSYDTHKWQDSQGKQIWLNADRIKGKAFLIYWPVDSMGWFNQEVAFE